MAFDPNYVASIEREELVFQFIDGMYWNENDGTFFVYAPEKTESSSIHKLCKLIGIDEDDAYEEFDRFREILEKTRTYWLAKWKEGLKCLT